MCVCLRCETCLFIWFTRKDTSIIGNKLRHCSTLKFSFCLISGKQTHKRNKRDHRKQECQTRIFFKSTLESSLQWGYQKWQTLLKGRHQSVWLMKQILYWRLLRLHCQKQKWLQRKVHKCKTSLDHLLLWKRIVCPAWRMHQKWMDYDNVCGHFLCA